jgi:prolyl-tRNA synthetase
VPINYHKSSRVRQVVDALYQDFLQADIEVLLDDRKERPGVLFKDSELVGIPHRVVISDTHVDENKVEYTQRKVGEKCSIELNNIVNVIKKISEENK